MQNFDKFRFYGPNFGPIWPFLAKSGPNLLPSNGLRGEGIAKKGPEYTEKPDFFGKSGIFSVYSGSRDPDLGPNPGPGPGPRPWGPGP